MTLTIAALLASAAALGACAAPTPATDSAKALPVAASGHQAGKETTESRAGGEETSIRDISVAHRSPSGGSAPCEIVAYSNSAENDLTAAKATRPELSKSTITELVADTCDSAEFREGQWVYSNGTLEAGMLENGTIHRITLRG